MITYIFLCWVMATACTVHCPAGYLEPRTTPLHVQLLTALKIIQNRKLYDVSGKEFVDLVYDSRVFHDCYDNIVTSTTEPCQYSEMLHIYAASVALSVCVNSYFPPQPRDANFVADMLSHIIRRAGISQSPHSTHNDNYMNWPMTM